MNKKFERLSLFFEQIKTVGFWQRIFGWRQIKSLSYDAYGEFKELLNSIDNNSQELERIKISTTATDSENERLKAEKIEIKEEMKQLRDKVARISDEITVFKQTENDRKVKYEGDVATFNTLTNQIRDDRNKEIDDRQKNEIKKLETMKETWAKHEEKVETTMKAICDKHTIEYVDKVPFKGSPDNTLKISDEFIIFDAKSPSSDDLTNFSTYVKTQTEAVKKYIKEDSVRKEIFLVIPSNTVGVIDQYCYNMADYTVYVVTLDVLEPLVLSLRKIEDYEFVDQLSPEERDNICRVIGKFAHITKRRIQIDQFFCSEFLAILTKCGADLPKDVLDKVIEFEKSDRMNPPVEKRSKQILVKDLMSESEKIKKEAEVKGIAFPDAVERNLKTLPLYENE